MITSDLLLNLMSNNQIILAYLGPGLGGGAIALILGIIASVFLAVFAVVWYPIKRLVRWLFKKGKNKATAPEKNVE